jgi:hypothetical protein
VDYSGLTVRPLFVLLPFGEADTQRPDIGQIASREHKRNLWYRGDGCADFECFQELEDFPFDRKSSKTDIFFHF